MMKWINTVPLGQVIPHGLSIRKPGRGENLFELIVLCPLFIWYWKKFYEVNSDEYEHGWRVFKIFISFGKGYGPVVNIRIAFAWIGL